MVIPGERTDDRHHFAVIALGLLMLAALYGVGAELVLRTAGPFLAPFELYSLAFVAGVWAAMLVTFGLNVVAHRLWGIDVVRFGPPRGT